MPSGVAGCVVRMASALNCWPCSLFTTHRPDASMNSPAVAEGRWPTTVTRSRTCWGLDAQHGKAVVRVVKRHPFDAARQRFGGTARHGHGGIILGLRVSFPAQMATS